MKRLVDLPERTGGVRAARFKKSKQKKRTDDGRYLECIICTRRYSTSDVVNGLYWVKTLVCSVCYAEMQAHPHAESCFGKPTFVLLDGKRLLGYDSSAVECNKLCPDREICRCIVDPAFHPEEKVTDEG